MKKHSPLHSVALVSTALVAFSTLAITTADARPVKGRPAKIAKAHEGGFKLGSALAPEIKAQREKFRVWNEDIRGGRKFFADSDHKQRKAYATTNRRIAKLIIDGRLSDKDGSALLDQVEAIGESTLAASNRAPLTTAQSQQFMDQMARVGATIDDQTKPLPPSFERTPNLNRFQLEARNLIRFGAESGAFSEAKAASFSRKLDTLQRHEESAKSGGELTDRERTKLFEEAIQLGRQLLKELRA